MKKSIKIFLIDDHQIIRDGIRALVNSEKDIIVVGESDGQLLRFEHIVSSQPDVVIMDISMGKVSGLELSEQLLLMKKDIKIIILSMFNNRESVEKTIEIGVMGYLSKNSAKEEILAAIRSVYEEKKYFNKEITDVLLKSILEKGRIKEEIEKPCVDCLTLREIEILKLFSEGFTNQEISQSLNISIRTVESHKTHIMSKLGFRTVVDMVKFAIKNNITGIDQS